MKNYDIKVLENTPIHPKYTVISIGEFRKCYPSIVNEHNTDEFLINYLNGGYKSSSIDIDYSKWFEVIEIKKNNFKPGDWVWHEQEQNAFTIVTWEVTSSMSKEWRPNYISLEAANSCTNTYKRKATLEEVEYNNLVSFCDGKVLIGQYKCYYFNNVWKELIGIHKNITKYLSAYKEYHTVSTLKQFSSNIEASWDCQLNGLKVGCTSISHDEIIEIAKQLKLK